MKRVTRRYHARALAVAACCAASSIIVSALAQPTRRATTIEALVLYPVFFHGKEVVFRAEAVGEHVLTWLVDDTVRILAIDIPPPVEGTREWLEIIGTFYDVGRLEKPDPRVADLPIERLSDQLLHKPWPGVGELPLVIATSWRQAREPRATTLRNIALEPKRYLNQDVTVTGRFRGLNLYGDLPKAPDENRSNFVLVSANAAVWVVGKEPKGKGFELDVLARVDTGRWLEVTGRIRVDEAMVLVEAGTIGLAEPATAPEPTPVAIETRQMPPPEVIFSAPLLGDVDVARDTTVRVQFSRDIDPDSLDGRVQISYTDSKSAQPGEPDPPTLAFEVEYRVLNRVLEIRFVDELDRFRALNVELLEGITATDGTPLNSWTLAFSTGG